MCKCWQIHDSPAKVNLCDERRKDPNPAIVNDKWHVGYVNKSDRMTISYSISHCTWKWKKKTVLSSPQSLNSHMLLNSCGSEVSHRDFKLTLVRNMVELDGQQPRPQTTMGRPSALVTRIGHLEDSSHQHWPSTTEGIECAVHQACTKKWRQIQTNCEKHNSGLCVSRNFKNYHA